MIPRRLLLAGATLCAALPTAAPRRTRAETRPHILSLGGADAGPPRRASPGRSGGLSVVILPETHTAAAALDRVRRVGTALGRAETAESVASRLQADLARVEADIEAAKAAAPIRSR